MAKTKKAASTAQPKPKSTAKLEAKLSWSTDKTFELDFTVPWKQVKTTYDQVLNTLAKSTDIKGFRQGKAPLKVVEKNLDKSKLYSEVINQLLPISFAQAVNQHQLKPAIAPKIQILKAEEGQDWQFKATSCELPQVKLGHYQQIVKGAVAKDKIWTPDKGDPKAKTKPETKENSTAKLNQIFQALLKEIDLKLPAILTEKERDRLLSQLLDQVRKLGLTIEQYASSSNKTVDQIRQEQEQMAANNLKIELIFQAIADDRKIEVKKAEIDKMIAAAGDEQLKKKLDTPSERAYIATVLRKRQVIDYLLTL